MTTITPVPAPPVADLTASYRRHAGALRGTVTRDGAALTVTSMGAIADALCQALTPGRGLPADAPGAGDADWVTWAEIAAWLFAIGAALDGRAPEYYSVPDLEEEDDTVPESGKDDDPAAEVESWQQLAAARSRVEWTAAWSDVLCQLPAENGRSAALQEITAVGAALMAAGW
jgi:hypothetical protein